MAEASDDIDSYILKDGQLFHTKGGKPQSLPHSDVPLADTHGHLTHFKGHDASVALCRAALAGLRFLVVPLDPVEDMFESDDPQNEVEQLLGWFDGQIERARGRLERCGKQGLVPPEFSGYKGIPALLDNIWFVAGVHPYGARQLVEDPRVFERLKLMVKDKRCVGIGEIGLDYGPYNELPADIQHEAFRLQLRLAHELNLPVELHIRDTPDDPHVRAHKEAAQILSEEGVPAAGCDLHCFTSGPEVLKDFVELGCHIAFGGALTFKRSEDIRVAARLCPQELLLSETDAPYMAPVPLRGLECEPAMVAFTVDRLCELRQEACGQNPAQTRQTLWENAHALFHKPTLI